MEPEGMTLRGALRTPRSAGFAGVIFAVLLIAIVVLLRLAAQSNPSGPHALSKIAGIMWATRLVPFAGLAFLWLIGVARDRLGDHEDRFFSTVFLGSGLLYIAMLFSASAMASGALISAQVHSEASTQAWEIDSGIAAILFNQYALRMAAAFMTSAANIGWRTRFMPRWLVFSGYAIATILLLGIGYTRWVQLLFPVWVLLFSLDTLVVSFKGGRAPALPN